MQTKLRESFAKKQKELEEMRQKAEERRSAAKNELDQVWLSPYRRRRRRVHACSDGAAAMDGPRRMPRPLYAVQCVKRVACSCTSSSVVS